MDKELSEYVYVGTTGVLVFYSKQYPDYGCIPLIGLANEGLFTADTAKAYPYKEDDHKRLN